MGISIWQLLIILGIVILLFGTKKLRNMGGDLGSAVKGFKSAVKDGSKDASMKKQIDQDDGDIIDAEVETKQNTKKKTH